MDEFIKKLIEKLNNRMGHLDSRYKILTDAGLLNESDKIADKMAEVDFIKQIVDELADECKEECNLQSDKILFAYSDLLRRFHQAEESCIWELSGSIDNDIKELEAECEELLGQFKEILYSADSPQKPESGWIACSERLPEDDLIYILTVEYPNNEIDVDYGWFDRIGVCWYVGMQEFRTSNVLAWQPLPAPYIPYEKTDSTKEAWKQQTMSRFERVE